MMHILKRYLNKKYIVGLCALLCLCTACRSDTDYIRDVDYSKLRYVIADNYNLSTFNAALEVTAYNELLAGEGPFTVLIPSNTAFLNAGLGANNIRLRSGAQNAALLNYHILEGRYALNQMPFLFNQEVQTRLGVPIYVTHWVQEGDTVLTINGSRMFVQDLQASNGVGQVIDQVLEPNVFEDVLDVISSRKDLTLFAQAIQRSGLSHLFRSAKSCTVFAPDNEAMNALGYSSIDAINVADPQVLGDMVRYHLMESRRFVNDFDLSMRYTQEGTYALDFYDAAMEEVVTANGRGSKRGSLNARMQDTHQVRLVYSKGQITVGQQNVDAYRMSIFDETNTETIVSPRYKNLVAKNGCVHLIDRVLRRL